jgi:hypothetical protein
MMKWLLCKRLRCIKSKQKSLRLFTSKAFCLGLTECLTRRFIEILVLQVFTSKAFIVWSDGTSYPNDLLNWNYFNPNKNPIVKLASQSNTNVLQPVASAMAL